ncbi:MAG TPA: type IV pilus modification protein PilV [Acinetobacter radioresistens]|uniref:Type IV pilus modification protein PilV n=1 Tax=Acinetobacter radioresistens TaxID=40216 RepID=A0A3D3G036_ACIRA|nr:type IV pilus modification protein PilV [Acinetobacter radioresistens]
MSMSTRSSQKGVGMMEVLIALVVLAIGVLGYVMLQVRAMEATAEGTQRIQAINIARDLAERVRVNRSGWTFAASPKSYFTEFSTTALQADRTKDCAALTAECSASELADYDVNELYNYSLQYGMNLGMAECPGNTAANNKRYCIFVAWGDTVASNSSTDTNSCVNGNAYRASSTCVMMEVY